MAGMIDLSRFSTRDLPVDERREAYLSRIDHALHTVFLSESPFAELTACFLGQLRMIELIASARRSERTVARIAQDRHDGISVQLVLRGGAHGEARGRAIVSRPGTVMLLDFAQPFVVIDEDERHVVNVAIPRNLLVKHIPDLHALHGMVLGAGAAGPLIDHLRMLPRRVAELPVYAGSMLGEMVLKLVVLALDVDPEAAQRPPADRRGVLTERARQLIEGRLGSADLTPEWLIERLNISRSDLYSLFEDVGGVVRYIWRRRLDSARNSLIDPHDARRIGEIAFANGFSSEAHFARAFRAAFGKTATEMRRGGSESVSLIT
jgi:AraC-like DNA-binding protein